MCTQLELTVSSCGHAVPQPSESVAPKAGLSPDMETRLCTVQYICTVLCSFTEEESTGNKQNCSPHLASALQVFQFEEKIEQLQLTAALSHYSTLQFKANLLTASPVEEIRPNIGQAGQNLHG